MIIRLVIAPAFVLAFAYWINQVNVRISEESLVPEVIAVGGGFSQYADTTTAPMQLTQGQWAFR